VNSSVSSDSETRGCQQRHGNSEVGHRRPTYRTSPKDRDYEANERSRSDTRRERYDSNTREGYPYADHGERSSSKDREHTEQWRDHREARISSQSHRERDENQSHQSIEGSRVAEHREGEGSRSHNDCTEVRESKDHGLDDSQRDDHTRLPPRNEDHPSGSSSDDTGSPANPVKDKQFSEELFSTEFLDE